MKCPIRLLEVVFKLEDTIWISNLEFPHLADLRDVVTSLDSIAPNLSLSYRNQLIVGMPFDFEEQSRKSGIPNNISISDYADAFGALDECWHPFIGDSVRGIDLKIPSKFPMLSISSQQTLYRVQQTY